MRQTLTLLCLCASLHAADPITGAISAAAHKPNVAVLDISGSYKDFSREELSALANRFETELSKTGEFQILERRNIDAILQEQKFQESGLCNTSECQVKVGELLGVERTISGSITKTADLISLDLKMVDVTTGASKLSHALDIKGDYQLVLRGGTYEMAQIFAGKKKPDAGRTVLAADSKLLWPWLVAGGALLVGGGVAAWAVTQGSTTSSRPNYTIEKDF